MAKPSTNLANLIPTRTAPRPVPAPEPEHAAVVPNSAPARRRQPSRAKTVMIAGHYDADVSFAVRELCGKLTRQQGKRVTVQQALAEALTLWFEKNGAVPPEGLSPQNIPEQP
jgi:hypothetical protein